jgi:legumain
LLLSGGAFAANWAVLIAGSNGFYNYRHQADICHAYQTLIKGGIPASNIIVFAFDDIASSSQNPIKGKLFNKPDGEDVYAGCKIDYKGKDVNPKNFLSVLKQDAAAMKDIGTGKVLQSTSQDKVFINFSDHGAPGLIAFPSSYLYATDLTPVLNSMWTKKQYNEAVFYLEACESGSMFTGFPTNQKFYALTAANADESSWGYYCPPDDNIKGVHIGSCLGDLFSIAWMEDTDASDTTQETLLKQFQNVKTKTDKSHVMQYGDLSFQSEPASNFVGSQKKSVAITTDVQGSTVSSRDAKLMYLVTRHSRLMSSDSQDELNEEIKSRRLYDELFTEIKTTTGKPPKAENTDFNCYKDMIESLEEVCGHTSDYGLKYFRHLYDLCACESCDHKQVKLLFYKKCMNTENTKTA